MYKCEHFSVHELVPPDVFNKRGEKSWELLDEHLLITLDKLRKRYGSMTINNYYWGKDREWSGLRTADSPYFSAYSQHSFRRAADCLFKGISANPGILFRYPVMSVQKDGGNVTAFEALEGLDH